MDTARSLVAAARAAIEAAESSVASTAATEVDLFKEANDFLSLATVTAELSTSLKVRCETKNKLHYETGLYTIIEHTIQFNYHYNY